MKKTILLFLFTFIVMTQLTSIKGLAMTDKEFKCTDTTMLYSVDDIIDNNNLVNKNCFKTFSEAKTYFDSIKASTPNAVIRYKDFGAPNKIVALNTGYAIATGGVTVNVYRNKNLYTNAQTGDFHTYVTGPNGSIGGTKMVYYGTEVNDAGRFVYRVAVSGYVGYVDANHADLLPSLYVEKDYPFTLRHVGTTKTFPKVDADYYSVQTNSAGKNELYYTYSLVGGSNGTIGPYALAPNWLAPGVYYSDNGNQFYSNFRMTNSVNNGEKFYSYYQYLPLRTRSTITGAELDRFLSAIGRTDSIYYGKSQSFVDAQNKYGMNALLVYAMAGIESAFGTSYYAKNRNNLFGWNAFDSDPDQATYFSSVSQAIHEHMGINLFGYTNINDSRFTAPSLGNKGAGFNTSYASDPYWGLKISAIAYQVDKANNYKDLNYYGLGILNDRSNINLFQQPSLSSPAYYNTKGETRQLVNQSIAITRTVSGFYETTSWFPIINGAALTQSNSGLYNNNIDKSLGYIATNQVKLISTGRWQALPAGTLPESGITPPPEPELGQAGQFKINATSGLTLRSQPNTSSSRLTVIPYNTVVSGNYVNNKTWIKTTYGGYTGYISASYVTVINVEEPVLKKYKVTADVGLIVRDGPSTSSTRIGLLPLNTEIEGELVLNGSWLKFTFEGKEAYVSASYVVEVTNSQPPTTSQINVPQTLGFTLVSKTLTGLSPNVSINSVITKLKAVDSSVTVTVVNSAKVAKTADKMLATGDMITITQANQPTQAFMIAVKGDINGDSRLTSGDYVLLANHLLRKTQQVNERFVAADINGDGKVTSSDYILLANHLLKKKLLY